MNIYIYVYYTYDIHATNGSFLAVSAMSPNKSLHHPSPTEINHWTVGFSTCLSTWHWRCQRVRNLGTVEDISSITSWKHI